jgi:hypothetical protein
MKLPCRAAPARDPETAEPDLAAGWWRGRPASTARERQGGSHSGVIQGAAGVADRAPGQVGQGLHCDVPAAGLGLEVLPENSGHLGWQAEVLGQAPGAAGGEVGAGSGSHFVAFYNRRLRLVKSCQGW